MKSLAILFMLCVVALMTLVARAEEAPSLRRPIAVCAMETSVLTANRNGTVTLIDLSTKKVVYESRVAKQLSSLVPITGSKSFLATDDVAHELCLLRLDEQGVRRTAAVPVSPYPVTVRVTSNGERAAVASLWSRRLTILQLAGDAAPQIERVVDLPFAPREQAILPGDQQLVVFDSFGGRLAVVEISTGKITLQREFPGHAVRGLALSPDGKMLLASHQMLNPFAHVNRSDMHWGLLMSNDLRWMRLSSLLDVDTELYAGGQVHPCGVPGRGGGDPAGTAVTRDGVVVVCLGGVNQVMIGTKQDLSLLPINVGRRPTAVAISTDDKFAIVANTFDDSLSLVDLASKQVTDTISLGKSPERTIVERGEELFHDATFSHEGWMSCHSCHTDGHSNFTRNDNLSDGGFGAPKLVISLLGRKDTAPFAWNAGTADLPAQVRSSIHSTMQSDRKTVSEEEVAAITAYVESLAAPPSVAELRGTADRLAIARGKAIFERSECAKCHAGPAFTVATLEDVGVKDELGSRRFNPPALSGVGQRDVLLHDGRVKSLESLFLEHRHPHGDELPADDVRDLVAYLRSL